jgi:hypothetical protein
LGARYEGSGMVPKGQRFESWCKLMLTEPWWLRGLIEAKYHFVSLQSASRSGFKPQLAIGIRIGKVSSKV